MARSLPEENLLVCGVNYQLLNCSTLLQWAYICRPIGPTDVGPMGCKWRSVPSERHLQSNVSQCVRSVGNRTRQLQNTVTEGYSWHFDGRIFNAPMIEIMKFQHRCRNTNKPGCVPAFAVNDLKFNKYKIQIGIVN